MNSPNLFFLASRGGLTYYGAYTSWSPPPSPYFIPFTFLNISVI